MRPFSSGGKKSTHYSHIGKHDSSFSSISKVYSILMFSILNKTHLSSVGKNLHMYSHAGGRKRRP